MKTKTTEQFVNEATCVHNGIYDYSKVKYKNASTKVTITCTQHGEFVQTPALHLRGSGCNKCHINSRYKTTDDFVFKANIVHNGKYDYSKVIYQHSKKHVVIICPSHGEFTQSPNPHLKGAGCPHCKKEILQTKLSSNTNDFISKSKIIHDNMYNYDEVVYVNNKIPVKIICYNHGFFTQRPDSHLTGRGCPKCRSSKAIIEIYKILTKNNIICKNEKRFPDCKNKISLPFDVYVKELNLCIEYDGRHHYEVIEHWGGIDAFESCKYNDSIKNQYCKDKNINLLRIKYDEDHIETLKQYFKETFGIDLKD